MLSRPTGERFADRRTTEPVTLVDWRQISADVSQLLFAREQKLWLRTLSWDASADWETIELARCTWGLPGLLAVDITGKIHGWTFYHHIDDVVVIGGLTAESAGAAASLMDAVLQHARVRSASAIACFMLVRAPGVQDALTARSFDVEPFAYLVQNLPTTSPARATAQLAPGLTVEGWRPRDLAVAAQLLRESYGDNGWYFAPGGSSREWRRYVQQLVEQTGCGIFDPAGTRVLRRGDRMVGLAFVTEVAADTAHIAQVAVHPELRGRGIARQLLQEACVCAAAAGKRRMTLLVGARNIPARALYDSLGFEQAAEFVAARRVITPTPCG